MKRIQIPRSVRIVLSTVAAIALLAWMGWDIHHSIVEDGVIEYYTKAPLQLVIVVAVACLLGLGIQGLSYVPENVRRRLRRAVWPSANVVFTCAFGLMCFVMFSLRPDKIHLADGELLVIDPPGAKSMRLSFAITGTVSAIALVVSWWQLLRRYRLSRMGMLRHDDA